MADRAAEAGGLALLAVAAAGALALATWSVQDPSLNHATHAPVRNLLGAPGAIAADVLMQVFGLGSIALLFPVSAWGWRLIAHRRFDREKLRLAAWFLGGPLAAGFAATLGRTAAWPLPTGLGGIVGDAMLALPRLFLPLFMPASGLIASLLFAAATAAVVTVASGFGLSGRRGDEQADADEEDEDPLLDAEDREPSLLLQLGRLTHWWLTLRGVVRRASAAVTAPSRPQNAAPVGMRDIIARLDADDGGSPYAKIERRTATTADRRAPAREAAPQPAAKPGRRAAAANRRAFDDDAYEMPPLTLLSPPKKHPGAAVSADTLEHNARTLEGVLEDFGVKGQIINVRPGPVVTLYELEPAPGIKSSRVIGLADDIARSMSAVSARVAVVPGRNVIGIELPNLKRETVFLRELLASEDFGTAKMRLPLCMGKTIGGEPVIAELARMPHLLIAGTTGSGKSVAINTMILSLLYRLKPEECRLIMIDPKMLELSVYDGIPHLLTPVVTDPKKAVVALKWAVREMEERYRKMSKVGVRNIDGFNARVVQATAKGESIARTVQTGFDDKTGEAVYERQEMELAALPYIVVVVDEMADLMMVAGKDIEGAIQRLAQMARAAGIHIVMATQRPSVDVITGTIKANFPTRISFQVTSKIDSRTILGEMGAEQLLGQGDMLYMAGGGRISRVHGPYVSDEEVESVVAHLKAQGSPDYLDAVTEEDAEADEGDAAPFDKGSFGEPGGDLYDQAVAVVLRDAKCSTSYIQRRLQIGYNRAASLVERMEKEGLVGPANHAGKREILVEQDRAAEGY
jgi:S-DNA-T family DNA segregation ATPase FtsK/SpoIIIE